MFAPDSEAAPRESKAGRSRMLAFLSRLCSLASARGGERRLHVCEMLSLGEKRFIAVVEYGGNKFLLAATPVNIALLQRLDASPEETEREALHGTGSGIRKFSQT